MHCSGEGGGSALSSLCCLSLGPSVRRGGVRVSGPGEYLKGFRFGCIGRRAGTNVDACSIVVELCYV